MNLVVKEFQCLVSLPLVAQMVKNLPARQEIWVRSLSQKYPLDKGIATHSNILGEGNGTPLQYSCLENPMDGRA